MSSRNLLRGTVLGLSMASLLLVAGQARAEKKPVYCLTGGGVAAPVNFAIQRNYGPIEERSERIPAELLTGGLGAPVAPVGCGFGFGFSRPWYGYYYGPRFNYGYGGPYWSYYQPYYGYAYRPAYYGYYGYGPYSVYRPWSYGAYYNRAPLVYGGYGGYGGCYYW